MGRLATLIAVFAASLALGACGGIDQEQFESEVVNTAQEPPDPIADAESADCPDDLSDEAGTEFTCTVTTTGGEEYEVTGTIVDSDTFSIDSQELIGGTTGAQGAE